MIVTFLCGPRRSAGQDVPVLVYVDPAAATGNAQLIHDFGSNTQPIVNQEAILIASGLPVGLSNVDVSYDGDPTHSGISQGYVIQMLAANDRVFTNGLETILPICAQ